MAEANALANKAKLAKGQVSKQKKKKLVSDVIKKLVSDVIKVDRQHGWTTLK